MRPLFYALHVLATGLIVVFAEERIKSYEQQIKEKIFVGYDRYIRPVLNTSTATKVRLNPSLFSISEVNFAQQTLTFKQWMRMYWTDEYLTWNPIDFGGVDSIMVERSAVWIPDIMIFEQTEVFQLPSEQYVVRVQHDGDVRTSVDQVVKIHCFFFAANFPYDTQTCPIRYASWMYKANEIDTGPTLPPDLESYKKNGEWSLQNVTAERTVSNYEGDIYVDVLYSITIARRPNYYIATFIWPSFLITSLAIIGIFSPFNAHGDRQEKVSMGLTTMLTMAVILMIVADQMPKSSIGMPLLGKFIMAQICLAALATVASVGVIHIHRLWQTGRPVPAFLMCIACLKGPRDASRHAGCVVRTWSESAIQNNGEEAAKQNNNSSTAVMTSAVTIKCSKDCLKMQWSAFTHRFDLLLTAIFISVNTYIASLMFLYS